METIMESIMETQGTNQIACCYSDNIHPWLKEHMQLVQKYYNREKFRENVTEGFLKLPNEIFMKSDERAERYRKNGNDHYKKNQFKEALREYNEAVAVASWKEPESEEINSELAIAFSNRSMCLLKLERYCEALADVNLALMHAKTEQLKKKLDYRRNECLKHLTVDEEKSYESFEESNVIWKNESTCLASRSFDTLDIVIRERPELSLLKKDYYFTRCFNCFKPFDMIIPCSGCNQVKFCSYACSVVAWNSGHQHLCLLLTLFDHLTNKEVFKMPPLLACQLVLRLDLPKIFQSAREGKLPENLNSISPSINDLNELEKMAESAAHLLVIFTVIKRLPAKDDLVPWKYDIELFGGLLLMFLRRVERDGRAVTTTELVKPLDENEIRYLNEKFIGFAIYNQVKKISHHCEPNVAIDIFNGRTITLRAIKKIEQGEPIKLDIGVNCKLSTVKERRAFLSSYGLECNCDACVQEIQPKAKAFLCPTCSGPVLIEDEVRCLKCNGIDVLNRSEVLSDLDHCLYNYRQANLSLIHRERDVIKAEDYLLDCYRKMKRICYPTNHNLTDIFDRLSYCYKKLRKYKLSLLYAQKAINCQNEVYHIFHKSRVNCFFNLLDRERNFVIWCVRRDKVNESEFHDTFIETRQSIQQNLKDAKLLIAALDFETKYYYSIIDSIQSDLSGHDLL